MAFSVVAESLNIRMGRNRPTEPVKLHEPHADL